MRRMRGLLKKNFLINYMYKIRNKLSWCIIDYCLLVKGIFHAHIGVITGITLMGTVLFSMEMIYLERKIIGF